MFEPFIYEKRISRIRSILRANNIEGILLVGMTNIRYLVGFTGSDAVLFIGEKISVLLIDGRYITQAGKEVTGCEILEYKDKIEGITALILDCGVKNIGFESSVLTCDQYFRLKDQLRGVVLKPLSTDIDSIRAIKDSNEIKYIRKAAHIASRSLMSIMEEIKPGMSEKDVALILESKMADSGGEGLSFETIVASGQNSALPHAKPGFNKIKEGDFVVIDYGSLYNGYHSDETRTLTMGKITEKQKKIYNIVKDAHDRALEAVKAGVSCREIDGIARGWIERAGFGQYFSHGTGHGVGLEVHEAPVISMNSEGFLEAGMVITVEPGIYIPGLWGIRIEDMALVERDGCDILSNISEELRIL